MQETPEQELWQGAYSRLKAMGYEDNDGYLKELCMQLHGDVPRIVNFLCDSGGQAPGANGFLGKVGGQMPQVATPSSEGRRGGFDVPTIPSAGESMGHGLGKEHDAMAKLQEMQADILKLPDQQRREAITNIIASQGASGNINMAQLASLLGQSGLGLGEVFNGGGGGEAPFSGAGAGHMLSNLGNLSAMLQGGPLSRLSARGSGSPWGSSGEGQGGGDRQGGGNTGGLMEALAGIPF